MKTITIPMSVLSDMTRQIDRHGKTCVRSREVARYFVRHGYTVRESNGNWIITI